MTWLAPLLQLLKELVGFLKLIFSKWFWREGIGKRTTRDAIQKHGLAPARVYIVFEKLVLGGTEYIAAGVYSSSHPIGPHGMITDADNSFQVPVSGLEDMDATASILNSVFLAISSEPFVALTVSCRDYIRYFQSPSLHVLNVIQSFHENHMLCMELGWWRNKGLRRARGLKNKRISDAHLSQKIKEAKAIKDKIFRGGTE